ncbi:bifunctional diaminohydroxyphosphoribosylaminopyrimidine deaminase/5-amino-6-(5-phosphoribosylamino)uracil reductase RibD [Nisaea acidiphila]|uniref:Riboflavin biosynthesis protein RibD n=1 Tax=Nisaea acidiphila TaxID=1862145 RepID=A0A9J7ASI5_9PROT|nr:bifunctional diaminohydroxyphosphoribosylaminopyrimidine deaminase/5-amino-6-(5-phosphoribosylamino)uracil reductase RibD [Nisaea acidiphila]UUX50231.1 bifunctional diaminohydroxyphosphoribosylaminopyrimidine deaminase/5-amino-6-(5-phosphoribosylamino)uracil reductase RibD [Nisaea acidiphila]
MQSDTFFMQHALALARRGLGRVAPNPAVGCVIVNDGVIVGRGWTQPGGRPHAEPVALKDAGELSRGATVYVSLEPCAHHGASPPCTDALIAAGVARVVYALRDPDPRVDGAGHTKLSEAGIDIAAGVLEKEAEDLNIGFLSRIRRNRPAVTLKLASSLDGKVALSNGRSQWITGAGARAVSHQIRATHDAIMTGIGTVLADDPALTCRLPGLFDRSPLRVILDGGLRLTPDQIVAETAREVPTVVFTAVSADSPNAAALHAGGVEIVGDMPVTENRLDLDAILAALAERGVTRLMIESGGELATTFLRRELVDELVWFRAPAIIGADGIGAVRDLGLELLEFMPRFERRDVRNVGEDLVETYRPRK